MNENKDLIVIVGQLTLDDAVSHTRNVQYDLPGGSALYSVAGANLWKKNKIGITTRKGYDFNLNVLDDFAEDYLDLSGIKEISDTPNIHLWNMFDRKGHRYFILQRWGGSEQMVPLPEDILQEYKDEAIAYHISCFPIKWQKEIVRSLPSGKIIQVDPHYDGVYPINHGIWHELFKKIEIFLPSEDELIRFFSIDKCDDIKDYIKYMKEIADYGPEIVTTKLGERGCLVYIKKNDESYHVPVFKTKIVDVTGCGDSFGGGFLTNYVKDKDAFNAAVCGTISSSFNIEEFGAMHNFSIPYSQVIKRYNDFMTQIDREKCRID